MHTGLILDGRHTRHGGIQTLGTRPREGYHPEIVVGDGLWDDARGLDGREEERETAGAFTG